MSESMNELEIPQVPVPPDRFAGMVIETEEQYQQACATMALISDALDKILAYYKPIVDELHQVHKAMCDERSRDTDPLAEAKKNLADATGKFLIEFEAARAAEEARLTEEAERLAQERTEDAVAELMDEGKIAEATEKLNAPVFVPPVILDRKPIQIPGIVIRTTHEAEVFDLMALVKAVAAGRVPLDAILPNMAYLNGMARDRRSLLGYPGVRVKPKATPVHKRGG